MTPKPTHPFEADSKQLHENIEAFVDATFADLTSEFLLLPTGSGHVEFSDFDAAYEVLKRYTHAFSTLAPGPILDALREDSRALVVLRSILGMSAPEWGDLVLSEGGPRIDMTAARNIDRRFRLDRTAFRSAEERYLRWEAAGRVSQAPVLYSRITALVQSAVKYLTQGAPLDAPGVIHRLAKFDTRHGTESIQYAASEHVPYSVVLYERYLGRPFATLRDANSGAIGDVMEDAVEERLRAAGVTYRKTKRAEKIPGFGQAPDFCIPNDEAPLLIIEAKITSDDGTARDKITRILNLVTQRDKHVSTGAKPYYEVVACIDGRGFRVRREAMRQLLSALDGKVFTAATLDRLFDYTRLRDFRTLP
jgi:hypothetical protein